MRISCLLLVLLVGLVSVCAAGDGARQNSSSQAAVESFNSDWLSPSAIARYDFVRVPADDRLGQHYSRSDSARDGELICYTIQNFVVKRVSPHSDATEPHGYSYCLPSWKYSVKTAEWSGQAPSR
jgi:hypothetical protein